MYTQEKKLSSSKAYKQMYLYQSRDKKKNTLHRTAWNYREYLKSVKYMLSLVWPVTNCLT